MTKNKRNRRKSCSSADATGKVENDGKDFVGKEKGGSRVVAGLEGTKSANGSIRAWFSSLSWQDRASVSCIDDVAFIATLLELASSSSGPHQGATSTTSTTASHAMKDTLDAQFSLERIEEAYKSNLVKAQSMEFAEGKEIHSGLQRSTANNMASSNKGKVEGSTPNKTVEEDGDVNTAKGSGPHLEGSAIPPTVDADTFRIRGVADAHKKEKHANKTRSLEADNGILNHLRLVYPSVYNIILSHPAFQDIHASSSQTLHTPVLTLDPRSLGDYSAEETLCHFDSLLRAAGLNEAFLSEDRYNKWQQSGETNASWIRLLKPKSPMSLALVLVVRLEASFMASFGADDKKDREHEAQLSFHVAAEAVERRSSRVPSSKSAMNHVLIMVPEQSRSELNMGGASLVLLPFSTVLHGVTARETPRPTESPLLAWNTAVKNAVTTLVEDKSLPEKNAKSNKNASQILKDGAHPSEHDIVVEAVVAPHLTTKKSKKKKKKKKRNVSNADQSSCSSLISESRSSIADDSFGDSQKKIDGRLALPKLGGAPVDPVKGSKNTVAISANLPPGGFETQLTAVKTDTDSGRSGASTGGVVGSVETTAKAGEKAAAAAPQDNKASHDAQDNKASHDVHDSADDAWETVEVRGRSGRNKRANSGHARNNDKSNATNGSNQGSSSTGATGSKKGKKNNRKRNASRKVAREILSSVLDDVDAEVRRRKAQVAKPTASRPILPARLPQSTSAPSQGSAWQAKPMTMRDVVLGRLREAETAANAKVKVPARPAANQERRETESNSNNAKAPILRNSQKSAWVADQSTAPTVPETLSGISANTDGDNASLSGVTSGEPVTERNTSAIDYSSSGDIAATQQNFKDEKNGTSPTPPLQTLLGPGDANSASSSVASSLEVPHGRRLHHHHSSVPNENDVGYHLLDVCDRLSRDMDVFMGRRAVALCVRRRERGALLAALQDTVTKLWPGRCHVEMYGSCATQLDLPSSDIDTVICGLDRRPDRMNTPPLQHQMSEDQMSAPRRANSEDEMSASPSVTSQESQQDSSWHHPYSPGTAKLMHVPALSPNAERVIRLAAELERQPWAVQVKAIPTASVPVVKILADPSRLPGAAAPVMNGGDWMMQQHHMAAQAAAAGMNQRPQVPGNAPPHPQGYYAPNNGAAHGAHYVHHSPPPWRGADVMNGLFQVDITFEGPEHGGIGSTAYSARFVQEACNEVCQPPDRAPTIQALMVLKELLAQRRLNEPFSGGLSSYALLLLVEAVLKERRAIQQEMEKIERQRLVVAGGDSNVSVRKQSGSSSRDSKRGSGKNRTKEEQAKNVTAQKAPLPTGTTKTSAQRGDVSFQKNKPKPEAAAKKSDPPAKKAAVKTTKSTTVTSKSAASTAPKTSGSSWASIAAAKKAPSKAPSKTGSQPNAKQSKPKPATKAGTFADAVSNRGKAVEPTPVPKKASRDDAKKQSPPPQQQSKSAPQPPPPTVVSLSNGSASTTDTKEATNSKDDSKPADSPSSTAAASAASGDSNDSSDSGFGASSLFPQGSNDVLEVLCSGENTAGKLLLHFLLYYGRHFDSHAMAIDLSGKHHPDAHLVGKRGHHNMHLSPYVPRTGGGSIDPVTGMLTVDPIVVYDPLEGAEDNNVARCCFAWSSIRWVFAQSYMTLSSAVERSGTPPATPSGNHGEGENGNRESTSSNARVDRRSGSADETRDTPPSDMVSPLLELLLSF